MLKIFINISLIGATMKTIVLLVLLTLSLGQVTFANETSVKTYKADQESKLCVAAANGKQSIEEIAKAEGVTEAELERKIKCNGIGIATFAKKFAKVKASDAATITDKNFELSGQFGNESSKLCVVAATGDLVKLQQVIRSQGMNLKYIVRHQKCNDMSFIDFVSKYGSDKAASELKAYL